MSSRKTTHPFTMVRRAIWGSRRFGGLPDDAARYLYFYYLTCPHQTAVGCMVLKEDYALADLRLTGAEWDAPTLRSKTADIAASGLIETDAETGEILITRWWQDNSPTNESWFVGALNQIDAIKSQKLRKIAQDSLGECWRAFQSAKVSPSPNGIRQPEPAPGRADLVATLNRRLGVAT